jgi:hypothetical protein
MPNWCENRLEVSGDANELMNTCAEDLRNMSIMKMLTLFST